MASPTINLKSNISRFFKNLNYKTSRILEGLNSYLVKSAGTLWPSAKKAKD